jgi:hypothetical protein
MFAAMLGAWLTAAVVAEGTPTAAIAEGATVATETGGYFDRWSAGAYDRTALRWEMGATWLARNPQDNVLIGRIVDLNSGQTLSSVSTDSMDFTLRPGMRALLEVFATDQTSVEFVYFGINEWVKRASLSTNSSSEPIFSPFLLYGIIPGSSDTAAVQDYVYDSVVNNTELNVRHYFLTSEERVISALIGFRWFSLQEAFTLSQGPFGNPPPQNERTRSITHNHLVGAQVGGEWLEYYGPVQAGVHAKGGLYGNVASMSVTNVETISDTLVTIIDLNKKGCDVAGIGDFGVSIAWPIVEGFNLRFAYDVVLVSSLALAPEQLPVNNPSLFPTSPVLKTDAFAVYHGPSVGFQLVW